jgi:toluene monooxygenase system protein D
VSSPVGDRLGVGPVLHATPLARTIVATMEEENDGVLVHDEGAYLRVRAPRICRLSRAAVEAAVGSMVQFPGELEVIMSSFAGRMRLNEDGAVWWLATDPPPEPPSAGPRLPPDGF